MKKGLTCILFAVFVTSAGAQQFYQDATNSEMVRPSEHRTANRREIVIPQVNGYNVYKADLHTHTIFSDGQVQPKYRVHEAWLDGLDIMAVTEHIEYRPVEGDMVAYLEKYIDEDYAAEVADFKEGKKKPAKDGKMVDLNASVKQSRAFAKGYGITIIPGVEITRDQYKVGHFNALFTTDNNLIYDKDPYKAILNAKAQGALVQHNHPGWKRTEIGYNEFQEKVYGEGLVDGVEVVNGREIYPGVVDRCLERGLYISANTDMHATTAATYRIYGDDRPMTLILAKDKSLESVREALEARRTLALAYGNVWGAEQLLKDMFLACVKIEHVTGRKYLFTNMSSVPYVVAVPGENPVHIDPATSVFFGAPKGGDSIVLEIRNMWSGADSYPTVEIPLK